MVTSIFGFIFLNALIQTNNEKCYLWEVLAMIYIEMNSNVVTS